jgi:hypothetical protein
VDPTPPPTWDPGPIEVPRELVGSILEDVARDVLRPALEAAGVADPGQYSLEYGDPVIPEPDPTIPQPAPTPPVVSYDDRPPRRPWVSVDALSATQSMPVIREP